MYNQIIGIVGQTGSGKSYTAAQIFGQQERAAVYQLVPKDVAYLHYADNVFDGDMKSLAVAMAQPKFRYIYRTPPESAVVQGNRFFFPDFETFVRLCFTRQEMLMIVDEAHFLCNPRFMPAEFWQSVVTGRHQFLDIAFVTQRLSMVHHDMTANAHMFYFWNITEPADLDVIADRGGKDISERVRNLRKTIDNRRKGGTVIPGECLVWKA